MSTTAHTFVSFNHVDIRDEFWSPRQAANVKGSIAAIYDYFKKTGRIDAFRLDWKPGMKPEPHFFWDSDVAKWIEAACYCLVAKDDPDLAGLVESVVDLVVSAQQADGYLNVYFTVVKPEARWKNLCDCHELYSAGHLIEAAVAHFRATGQRKFLDSMCRFADHIDGRFGSEPGKARGYCGHEEIELALVKLYHATRNERYLRLARFFVDERGRSPHYFDIEKPTRTFEPFGDAHARHTAGNRYKYMQAHVPLREQGEVVGHAVRAMYIYTAMADLAAETGDESLMNACQALWDDLTLRKMYLTGGVGSSKENEGFTGPYDLPNLTAYAETCAAIGLVFWAQRMLRIARDGRYADVMERALYNGVISGVSLDGKRFFYVNPLASTGTHRREEGFGCSCCPPNLARLVASLGDYICSVGDGELAVHFYVAGVTRAQLPDGRDVELQATTRYPWEGRIDLRLGLAGPSEFTVRLRVPGWCRRHRLTVNGQATKARIRNGYARVNRSWQDGDTITLELDMPVERIEAHPDVLADQGRVALQRGPLVYCLEDVDHAVSVQRLALPDRAKLTPRFDAGLLGGVTVLEGDAVACEEREWSGRLHRMLGRKRKRVAVKAIPYFAWENRSPGGMAVWLPRV